MTPIFLIAVKEFRDGMRNRWVIAITILLAVFALTLSFLGSAPTGAVKTTPLAVTVVSLSSLTIFLVPLIALLLSYDAIVGDIDRGTMALLLSYPVARHEVIVGKYLGHLGILAVATTVGYGVAGVLSQWATSGDFYLETWLPFFALIGSSILLGACFLAMGYLISTCVRDRATAAGIAIGVWLFFVLIYDMALLGALVADQGRYLTSDMVGWFLLLNPADVYRLINLTGFTETAQFSGMAGLTDQAQTSMSILAGALIAWTVVPFLAAAAVFQRKQI